MVLEIAEGLESIHRCGYIHRDIKVDLSLPSQLARQSPHEGRPYPDRRFRVRETASAEQHRSHQPGDAVNVVLWLWTQWQRGSGAAVWREGKR